MYLFSGLQFQHSSSEGVDGYNFGTQSAIRIVNGDDIIISDCEFSHIGMTAVFVKTSNRITISNNVQSKLDIADFLVTSKLSAISSFSAIQIVHYLKKKSFIFQKGRKITRFSKKIVR